MASDHGVADLWRLHSRLHLEHLSVTEHREVQPTRFGRGSVGKRVACGWVDAGTTQDWGGTREVNRGKPPNFGLELADRGDGRHFLSLVAVELGGSFVVLDGIFRTAHTN